MGNRKEAGHDNARLIIVCTRVANCWFPKVNSIYNGQRVENLSLDNWAHIRRARLESLPWAGIGHCKEPGDGRPPRFKTVARRPSRSDLGSPRGGEPIAREASSLVYDFRGQAVLLPNLFTGGGSNFPPMLSQGRVAEGMIAARRLRRSSPSMWLNVPSGSMAAVTRSGERVRLGSVSRPSAATSQSSLQCQLPTAGSPNHCGLTPRNHRAWVAARAPYPTLAQLGVGMTARGFSGVFDVTVRLMRSRIQMLEML